MEQIIEFELGGLCPLIVHILLQPVIFMQKSLRKFSRGFLLLQK